MSIKERMVAQTQTATGPMHLLQFANGVVVQQGIHAAAVLGVADLLKDGPLTAAELAKRVEVDEEALYRILRLLAGHGIFEEIAPRTFGNSELSHYLRADVPGSLRAVFIFRGSSYFYSPFKEILYSVRTGLSAREKVHGMGGWEFLRRNPEEARIFDEAMTAMSGFVGPAVASAYDFGAWGSLMDVGGGNGMLLATILRAHPNLRGVLADQAHVIERARGRGFLGGELASRASYEECDFFESIPGGCRAYLMKSVIHDWDDEQARAILKNCREAVPSDGVLLLVEYCLGEEAKPSFADSVDVVMLVLTGGKERTEGGFRELLTSSGFRLNRVLPTPAGVSIIEAMPG
jgi:DNA-binding Lrp family transcriptional regulator